MILPLVADRQPCYILYRLDSANAAGDEWSFIAFVPDGSSVCSLVNFARARALR